MSHHPVSKTTRDYLLKPAAAAGIAAGAAAIWRPGAKLVIPGMGNYSYAAVAALATFLGVEVCSLINDHLFSHIPVINALEAPAHTALNVGALAAITAGLENTLSPGIGSELPLTEVAAFAAAAEVGSSYLVDDLVLPMYAKWKGDSIHY